MPIQEDLYEFMIEELGGQNAVYGKFYRQRIAELAAEGATLAELRKAAEDDGWLDWFDKQAVSDIAQIVTAGSHVGGQSFAPAKKPRGRMTAKERDALYGNVLDFLADNPWSSNREIAEAVDMEPRKLGLHLKKLKEAGELKTEGNKSQMRYARAKEKSKP